MARDWMLEVPESFEEENYPQTFYSTLLACLVRTDTFIVSYIYLHMKVECCEGREARGNPIDCFLICENTFHSRHSRLPFVCIDT